MSFAVALTVIIASVVRSPFKSNVAPVPPVNVSVPVVEETAALTASSAAALMSTVPLPSAVTRLLIVTAPTVLLISTLPLPAVVVLPLVVIASPATTIMSPLVVVLRPAKSTPSVSVR